MWLWSEWIPKLAAGAFLIPCTVSDIRQKSLPAGLLCAAGGLTAAFAVILTARGECTAAQMLAALVPGAFLLSAALLTGGHIGTGDGLVFLIVGPLVGCGNVFLILFLALGMSAVWGGLLLVLKKAGTRFVMPWMPFVLAGYLVWIIGCCLIP